MKPSTGSWQLTETGIEAARRDAKNLQLWDLYRFHADDLNLPLLQEDRHLDIRNVLPADVIKQLETMTKERV